MPAGTILTFNQLISETKSAVEMLGDPDVGSRRGRSSLKPGADYSIKIKKRMPVPSNLRGAASPGGMVTRGRLGGSAPRLSA